MATRSTLGRTSNALDFSSVRFSSAKTHELRANRTIQDNILSASRYMDFAEQGATLAGFCLDHSCIQARRVVGGFKLPSTKAKTRAAEDCEKGGICVDGVAGPSPCKLRAARLDPATDTVLCRFGVCGRCDFNVRNDDDNGAKRIVFV